ncbi:hypothetical protein GW915_07695 [bacterium]|nr:hypothetical protein [bacterium]
MKALWLGLTLISSSEICFASDPCLLTNIWGREILKHTQSSESFDADAVIAKLKEAKLGWDMVDELYRISFDLNLDLQGLENSLESITKRIASKIPQTKLSLMTEQQLQNHCLQEPLYFHTQKKINALKRSKLRMESILGKIENPNHPFEIPAFTTIQNDYSTAATHTGLRYRGNPNFLRHLENLRKQTEERSEQISKQLDHLDLEDPRSTEILETASRLSSEHVYYEEMLKVAMGQYTGVPAKTMQSSPYTIRATFIPN